LKALAEASARGGSGYYEDGSYNGAYDNGAYNANAYDHEPYRRYYGPQATIGPDGRPVETPEVQAATAHHLAAHAALRTGHYYAGPGHYYK